MSVKRGSTCQNLQENDLSKSVSLILQQCSRYTCLSGVSQLNITYKNLFFMPTQIYFFFFDLLAFDWV